MGKTATQKRNDEIRRESGTLEINEMCAEIGLNVRWLTPYQARIENSFDVFPTNRKWHFINTGERGQYNSPEQLFSVMERISRI